MNERKELRPLLFARAVQQILGISKATLWRLMRRGEIRPVRIGRRTLFRQEDVKALINRGLQ